MSNVTMIYVTHDQVEAKTLADRIAVLRDCRLEQVGTPAALYKNPNSLFVAGFIVRRPGKAAIAVDAKVSPTPQVANLHRFDVDGKPIR